MTVCILSNYGSEFQICSNVRMRMINIIFYKEALKQGRQFDHRSGALDLTKMVGSSMIRGSTAIGKEYFKKVP